ncbi:SIS domain-containing protein [Labrys monachus]|uniref:Glutamine--fructose-6-phosphate aminotransferase [isomerizing] n=1 Tax=Labrys monachus TaxID=217067 RepID=A0ABU0FCJ1_9HYPH|nr:SIS domain-containing protein [Labrys monachus]MDQ0392333.1 fructoselysine-6-P-deglycase FrlB-like protein [Labrys monachus]
MNTETTAFVPGTGLAMIEAEMARQHADALASFHGAGVMAERIADSIGLTGRLTLAAMGGSHWVNRAAAVLYRRLGIEVETEVLSELLITPQPDRPRTVLVTSQSGNSGEVVAFLDRSAGRQERFGLTLDAQSALGSRLPSLVGVGGPERAFAATRSILVSHALHLAVLKALGMAAEPALAILQAPVLPPLEAALAALAASAALVLSGRAELQGVAESGALCVMELARLPALGLEGGQLRHGPMEMLSADTGVVLLRAAGSSAALAPGLAAACRAAGSPVVVLDVSGEAPVADAVTLALPKAEGMAAILSVLPALQTLLVTFAARRVRHVGEPVRSTKVTTEL